MKHTIIINGKLKFIYLKNLFYLICPIYSILFIEKKIILRKYILCVIIIIRLIIF